VQLPQNLAHESFADALTPPLRRGEDGRDRRARNRTTAEPLSDSLHPHRCFQPAAANCHPAFVERRGRVHFDPLRRDRERLGDQGAELLAIFLLHGTNLEVAGCHRNGLTRAPARRSLRPR
jgi:hypothetical protein